MFKPTRTSHLATSSLPLNVSYKLVAKIQKKKGSDDVRWKEIKIDIKGRKLSKEREA